MPNTIIVSPSSTYGVLRYYPRNDLAEAMTEITETKTIPSRVLGILKKAGFTIEMIEPEHEHHF